MRKREREWHLGFSWAEMARWEVDMDGGKKLGERDLGGGTRG